MWGAKAITTLKSYIRRGGLCQSTLQNQVTQFIEGLSDDSPIFILDMIQRFVMPTESKRVDINHDVNAKGKNAGLEV